MKCHSLVSGKSKKIFHNVVCILPSMLNIKIQCQDESYCIRLVHQTRCWCRIVTATVEQTSAESYKNIYCPKATSILDIYARPVRI